MNLDVGLCKNSCRLQWKLVSTEEPMFCGHIVKSFLNALACWNSLLSLTDLGTVVVIEEKMPGQLFCAKQSGKNTKTEVERETSS